MKHVLLVHCSENKTSPCRLFYVAGTCIDQQIFKGARARVNNISRQYYYKQGWDPWVSKQEGLTKISYEFQKLLIGSQKLSKSIHTKAK